MLALDERIVLLAIDDSPGRYDELAANPEVFVTVTRDPEVVALILAAGMADGILLDHDMPDRDGREWARELSFCPPLPVVITSTTGTLPDPRPEMAATLRDAGVPVLLCPADHFGCEAEWVAWVLEQMAGGS